MIRRLFLLYLLFFTLFTGVYLWGQMKKADERREQNMEMFWTRNTMARAGVPDAAQECVAQYMNRNNLAINSDNKAFMRKYSDLCVDRCLVGGNTHWQCTFSLADHLDRDRMELLEVIPPRKRN